MLALLLMAAQPIQPAAPAETLVCEHLDESQVTLLIERTETEIASNPYYAPALSDLVKYWKSICANQRYNASKYIVRKLSNLLSHWEAVLAIASMLIDVGPNLKASRQDLDAAIVTETVREDAAPKSSSPIAPESGRPVSYS